MEKSVATNHIDPRYYQISFLLSFLLFGTWVLGWDQEILRIIVLVLTSVLTQVAFIVAGKSNWSGIKSALITSLGLSLLLRSQDYWVLMLAATIAISTKFLVQYKGKHIFNPANIGIVAAVLFTGKAWISPGQWGSDIWYPISILTAGIIVCLKVKRAQTGLLFLGVLFLLEFTKRYLYLGWPADLVLHRFSSGSLLVYALFMITDPMTTPNHPKARMIWASVLAIFTFVLSSFFQIYEAPIWALFFLSPVTPLFDKFFVAGKFEWVSQINTKVKLYEKSV